MSFSHDKRSLEGVNRYVVDRLVLATGAQAVEYIPVCRVDFGRKPETHADAVDFVRGVTTVLEHGKRLNPRPAAKESVEMTRAC